MEINKLPISKICVGKASEIDSAVAVNVLHVKK